MLYDRLTDLIRHVYDRRLLDPPVLDAAWRFPSGQHFVDGWAALRDEALRLSGEMDQIPRFHELMSAQASISANDDRDWRMFVLKAYGVPVRRNMAKCPVLAGLIESAPEVLSATLSYLAPRKHIPEHRGPFRGILRFYLGLSVPTTDDGLPATVLTIDGIDYRLAEGESLLWDDTFPHEVRNNSDKLRIALLLDVRRQGMPLDMELLSRLLIGVVSAAVRVRRLT